MGRRLLLRNSGEFVPIFMLHRFQTPDGTVAGHDPELVRAALTYLVANDFRVLNIDEAIQGLVEHSLPERVVAFTMDDGYRDQAEVGAEVFIAHDCPVTIYLITGLTDGRLWPWEAKLSYLFGRASREFRVEIGGRVLQVSPRHPEDLSRRRRELLWAWKALPMFKAEEGVAGLAWQLDIELPEAPPPEFCPFGWQEAMALEARGVSFGGHTVSHVTLSAEDDDTSRRELEECTRQLREHFRRPSAVFCYPTGRFQDYGAREVACLRELGYSAALSAEPGYCALDGDVNSRFNIRRFGFPDNLLDFKDIVLQLQRLRERSRFARKA